MQNTAMSGNFLLILLLCLFCSIGTVGCGSEQETEKPIRVSAVFEDTEGLEVEHPVQSVARGETAVFTVKVAEGYALERVDYDGAEIGLQIDQQPVTIRLPEVKYSTVVRAELTKKPIAIHYHANGGTVIGEAANDTVTRHLADTHLRINTAIGTDLFERDGYTLIGWNTEADGSGRSIGLGSRVPIERKLRQTKDGEQTEYGALSLYAQWEKWTSADCFTYDVQQGNAQITGFQPKQEDAQSRTLVIPTQLDGHPVTTLTDHALASDTCEQLILPPTLQAIGHQAVQCPKLTELYLYDQIQRVTDGSFEACPSLTTLHINALVPPVYSCNYFAAFADKYDWLCSIHDQKKIVLFSGSSTRFGYDSSQIDHAFPDRTVSNMGVFAYSNALPQALLILRQMQPGDVLLDAPELDAAKRQFFTSNALDAPFFCMLEANYDMLAELDLTEFTRVFSSFQTYLTDKRDMEPKGYELSPSDYDEDGNRIEGNSYNQYGDYIVERPNAVSDDPVYGLPVRYTSDAYPYNDYLKPANDLFSRFLQKGIKVLVTYSPRNRQAISEESTESARAELDAYLRESLIVPIISQLEDSLYPGRYLYGTDNHLSTEGVKLRTEQVIADLKRCLQSNPS